MKASGKGSRGIWAGWLAVAMVLCSVSPVVDLAWSQDTFEREPTLAASEILPAEQVAGPHHRVDEAVSNDGYMNTYRIHTDFGELTAYGDAMLYIRLLEVEALARLDEVSKSKVFLDAAGDAALHQVKAVKTLAEKPVATLKGVPGGVKRMFRSTKRDVDEGVETAKEIVDADENAEEGEAAEGSGEDDKGLVSEGAEAATKYGKKYLGVSGAERRWAEKLGVDPYTSNEILIREIKKVAKVDAAGGFLTRLAPIPTIPGASYVQDVNKLVWSMDPRELRERNVKMLATAGAAQELIDEFFANPWYSPSLQTHLLAAFAQLEGVAGLGTVLRQAAAAESEEEAVFFLEAIRMLAGFHTSSTPVERLEAGARLPGVRAKGGRLVFLVPVDHISWTEGIAAAAEGPFRQAATGLGIESREVWFRGTASQRCRDELTARGWRVIDAVELPSE